MAWQDQINNMFGASGNSGGSSGSPNNNGSGNSWGNIFGQGLSGLAGYLGGQSNANGYDNMSNQIQNAQNQQNQLYDQGLGYYKPYYDQGTSAFNQYGSAINQMSDPSGYVNDLMSKYQSSPNAQFQIQEGTRAANNASAASGQLGSAAEQMGLQRYAQGVSSADQQQYLNNAMGVQNQYLQGLQNQSNMGYNAGQGMANNRQGLADNLATLLQNLGLSQANSGAASGGGLGDLLGAGASIASMF